MDFPSILSVTPLYAAILALIFCVITARVGLYRVKNEILIGDGGDAELLRRARGQQNFAETVPIALILLVLMELCGASNTWLHSLGAALVFGRACHYVALTELGPGILRPVGMAGTLIPILVSAVWLLLKVI